VCSWLLTTQNRQPTTENWVRDMHALLGENELRQVSIGSFVIVLVDIAVKPGEVRV
jgi:hypothetical protein